AGADSVSREPLHFPLAVGVGRSGPSPTPPTARVVHPRPTSPEPEAEGESPPALPTTSAMADVIRDAHPSIRDHPIARTSPIIAIQGTPPFIEVTVGDGAAVGLRSGVVHWSSRPQGTAWLRSTPAMVRSITPSRSGPIPPDRRLLRRPVAAHLEEVVVGP